VLFIVEDNKVVSLEIMAAIAAIQMEDQDSLVSDTDIHSEIKVVRK
jgi:hypothetical protein